MTAISFHGNTDMPPMSFYRDTSMARFMKAMETVDSNLVARAFPCLYRKALGTRLNEDHCTHDHIKCIFVSAPTAAPENFTAISLSFNSINVSWEPVPEVHRRGIIIGYEVKVQNNTAKQSLSFSVSENSGVIRDLQMFVDYKLCVRALTRIGAGPYSEPLKILRTNIAGTVVKSLDFC